jgi:hypothetical protein
MQMCDSESSSYPTDFLASVFDALPAPALVVDREVRMIDFNIQAARLIERVPFAILRPPAGQSLACIHAAESPEGCGHATACPECPIRNLVREAFETGQTRRRMAHMELTRNGRSAAVDLLVSVTPIPDESEPVALLILEDAAELSKLLGNTSRGADDRFMSSAQPRKRERRKTTRSAH